MKTFIATITKSTISRTYGGTNESADIYRIINNTPKFVTSCHWCTRGYRGDIHEVMNALVDAKQIPKKFRGYYHANDHFTIHMI